MTTPAQHRRELARRRQRVIRLRADLRAEIDLRNIAVRAAKAAGIPAAEAYDLAGIDQGNYSKWLAKKGSDEATG